MKTLISKLTGCINAFAKFLIEISLLQKYSHRCRGNFLPGGEGGGALNQLPKQFSQVSLPKFLLLPKILSFFKIGNERPLHENDFLPLSKENSASFLTDQLQQNWNKEKTKCNRNRKRPRLWKSVIKLISVKDAMIIAFTSALRSLSRLLQPLFFGTSYFNTDFR